MNSRSLLALSVVGLLASQAALANEEAARGADRAGTGARNAVTSPVKIVDGINADTEKYGPAGVITGSVKGGAQAAAQFVTGAVNVGVGIVEVLVSPLAGE